MMEVGGFQVAGLRVDLVPDTEGQNVEQGGLVGIKAPCKQVALVLWQQSLLPLASIPQGGKHRFIVRVRGRDQTRLLAGGDPDAGLVAAMAVPRALIKHPQGEGMHGKREPHIGALTDGIGKRCGARGR